MSSEINKTDIALKFLKLILLIYLFFISIGLLKEGFGLFGKDFANNLIKTTANPIVGLCIGILATSLVQSSSFTTTTLVTMVAGGSMSIENAIPIVMGANIGTTITNTIVACANMTRKQEFERGFAAAIVHDFFNILSVLIFLPLELKTHFLSKLAYLSVGFFKQFGGFELFDILDIIVKPVAKLISHTIVNITSDGSVFAPILCLTVACAFLFIALRYLVDTLKSIMIGPVEKLVHNYLFANWWRALIVGTLVTMSVQSSSITTSLAVPMAAGGILALEKIFPFTLGANIGTTITAILASMALGEPAPMTVAMVHLWFNISGTAIFLPLQKIPITLARKTATLVTRNKWGVILFILIIFFLIPIIIITLE